MQVDLLENAAAQQRECDESIAAAERKEIGHFGTPSAIAVFMAEMFQEIPTGRVRILDAGAGVGTLSAAICQRVLNEETPRHLDFELWENDARLESHLRATMDTCRKLLRRAGHEMEYTLRTDDFILSNAPETLFDSGPEASFHLAILNPPYFKLRKESPHARAMNHIVHGQPNIYSCFMSVAAELLLPGGELVAITPRSYFNGLYFKRFRRWFFSRVTARQIHVFESRSLAFQGDAVLQENVILRAQKGGEPHDILVTANQGHDFTQLMRNEVAHNKVIDDSNGDCVVRIAVNSHEREVLDIIDALPNRFTDLGYSISTGPVVTFRATEFLRANRAADTAPLLWMHNVRPFVTQFPQKNGKPPHITVSKASKRLLLPAKRYVLLKRFTSKEEAKRLVAGVVRAEDSYSNWLGLENHLNYVYRAEGELSQAEANGLAAYFNSTLVDRYFRAISGNTQVNASEIRNMPVPDQTTLCRIGDQVAALAELEGSVIEQIVGRALCLTDQLIGQLCKVDDE